MSGKSRCWLALILAGLAGVISGECICRSPMLRNIIGNQAGRGELLAIVRGTGIYAGDRIDPDASIRDLVAEKNLRRVALKTSVSPSDVTHEDDLLRAQFGTDAAFEKAIRANGVDDKFLREEVSAHLRGRGWLDAQIPATTVSDSESQAFFDSHQAAFVQPVRYRASHIFLIAPAGTSDDVIEQQRQSIAAIAARLAKGESFSSLAAEFSEDEATKLRGGDLGFFATSRMPSEFMEEIAKMRPGETGKPFRSHLGFHIIQLTDLKPARALLFDEARPEITTFLANRMRVEKVTNLAENLAISDYIRAEK